MKQYDAIIIGFGKGGKTLAAELAKRKLDVAVVERSEKMYGGTCINIGCIKDKEERKRILQIQRAIAIPQKPMTAAEVGSLFG